MSKDQIKPIEIQKEEARKTALCSSHKKLGAKLMNFSGWLLPVSYSNIGEEHQAVRNSVGLFDVSHMGEFRVQGKNSLKTLQSLTTNDVNQLDDGMAQYALLLNESGGIIDDLIIYCLKRNEDYLLCVNAACAEKDFSWISKNNKEAKLTDETDKWSLIAVQGPKTPDLLEKIFNNNANKSKDTLAWATTRAFAVFEVLSDTLGLPSDGDSENEKCIIARTGYTGEWGVEIFVPNKKALELWEALLEKGQEFGVKPIGLGARDSLRMEKKYSLYGQEINEKTNPYEANLGWVVKPQGKPEGFIGCEALKEIKKEGLKQKLVGFKLLDRGIPRSGYKCLSPEGKEIGFVTSGTMSPTLGEALGIGYVEFQYSKVGSEFLVNLRGREAKAIVVKTPFV